MEVLNEHVRRITIYARSKRWWYEDIRDRHRVLGRAKRRGTRGEVRIARRELRRTIRKARRECWEDFLNRAYGEDIWAVTRYTKPQRSAAVPTIRHQGMVADCHEDKARMLDIPFPVPTPYSGDKGESGPPGTAH